MPKIRIKPWARNVGRVPFPKVSPPKITKPTNTTSMPMGSVKRARSNLTPGGPIKNRHVQRGDMIMKKGTKTPLAVLSNKMGTISAEKRAGYVRTVVRIHKSESKPLTYHGSATIYKVARSGPGPMGKRNLAAYTKQLRGY